MTKFHEIAVQSDAEMSKEDLESYEGKVKLKVEEFRINNKLKVSEKKRELTQAVRSLVRGGTDDYEKVLLLQADIAALTRAGERNDAFEAEYLTEIDAW